MRFLMFLLVLAASGCSDSALVPDMAAPSDQSVVPTGDAAGAGSCKDGIKNGQETDVDCGGPTCPTCGLGKICLGATDCQSADCVNNVCASPSGEMGAGGDMAMSMGGDLAGQVGIACTFDDPSSLFDDCTVGP